MFISSNADSSISAGLSLTDGSGEATYALPTLPLLLTAGSTAPSPVGSTPAGTQITFIDTRVDNYQQLADSIIAGDIFFLDSARNGIEQITETLADYDDITGLHLVSHGDTGRLQLGNALVDTTALTQYEQAIQSWEQALASEADIMVYGCEVGAGHEGAAFVKQLSQLTGADVAASDDLTGSAALNGDWDLELTTGVIETSTIFNAAVAAYEGTLATFSEAGTVRVLPLGDSITRTGDPRFDSYRRDLWKTLVANGYNNLDFVGGGDFTGPNNDYDTGHEGHGGWRADQIADNTTRYAQTYNPDVVLLHIGTNDANQGQSVSSTLGDIGQIIDRLRSHNPNIAVLLAKNIPSSFNRNATQATAVQALSSAIPSFAQSKNQSGSPVILVDQSSGFDSEADTYDGLHPDDSGQAKMAAKWYSALDGLFQSGHQYNRASSSGGSGGGSDGGSDGNSGGNPPAGSGNGLKAEYYDNIDFTNLALTRTDSSINFDWGNGSPSGNISADTFSARWTGQIEPRYSETYTFNTTSDDGIRLWINNQLIIDRFYDQAPTEHSGQITLNAGQKYDIRMEYYEKGGGAVAQLSWSSASQSKEIVPQSQLFSSGSSGSGSGDGSDRGNGGNSGSNSGSGGDGLLAQYFDNYNYTNLKETRIDPNVNFDWGAGSPSSNVGGDGFSARWTGFVEAEYTEKYTFYTSIDDGVQLWVNGLLLVDHLVSPSSGEFSGSIDLVAGQKYDIRMEYFEDGGDAVAKLSWSSASQAKQIIPQSQLFSSANSGGNNGGNNSGAGGDSGGGNPPDEGSGTTPPVDNGGSTPTPSNGNGLQAQYFDNYNYTNLKETRTDANIDFDWGAGSPSAKVGADGFSARWTGKIEPLYSEKYTFYTTIDDGVQLWVNGQLLVDHLVSPSSGEFSGSIDLVAGQKYDIRMEYFEDGGDAVAKLSWSSASQAKQIVPQSQLFSGDALTAPGGGNPGGGNSGGGNSGGGNSGGSNSGRRRPQAPPPVLTIPASGTGNGLRAQYFDNYNYTNLKETRTDANINFNWGAGSPSSNVGADGFSARWTGQLEAQYTERYTFYTTIDDGVQLWVNDQLLVDHLVSPSSGEFSGSIDLVAGQKYDIRMEYFEDGGDALAQLSWSSASQAKQIVPQSQLYS